eukprot:g43793.t1
MEEFLPQNLMFAWHCFTRAEPLGAAGNGRRRRQALPRNRPWDYTESETSEEEEIGEGEDAHEKEEEKGEGVVVEQIQCNSPETVGEAEAILLRIGTCIRFVSSDRETKTELERRLYNVTCYVKHPRTHVHIQVDCQSHGHSLRNVKKGQLSLKLVAISELDFNSSSHIVQTGDGLPDCLISVLRALSDASCPKPMLPVVRVVDNIPIWALPVDVGHSAQLSFQRLELHNTPGCKQDSAARPTQMNWESPNPVYANDHHKFLRFHEWDAKEPAIRISGQEQLIVQSVGARESTTLQSYVAKLCKYLLQDYLRGGRPVPGVDSKGDVYSLRTEIEKWLTMTTEKGVKRLGQIVERFLKVVFVFVVAPPHSHDHRVTQSNACR